MHIAAGIIFLVKINAVKVRAAQSQFVLSIFSTKIVSPYGKKDAL
jgi:hypothetical protein